jgi:hypothetical protein
METCLLSVNLQQLTCQKMKFLVKKSMTQLILTTLTSQNVSVPSTKTQKQDKLDIPVAFVLNPLYIAQVYRNMKLRLTVEGTVSFV